MFTLPDTYTDTDKNGIVGRCLYCTDTNTESDTDANGLQIHFVGVSISVCVGVGHCEHCIKDIELLLTFYKNAHSY